jgi:hypothetical protein
MSRFLYPEILVGDVRSRYNYLRKFGPNDGSTLLADDLMPGGITIVEPGFDHFYRDPDINLKSLALANLVAEKLTIRSSFRKQSVDLIKWCPDRDLDIVSQLRPARLAQRSFDHL